jgi:hypothetical protein
MAEKLFIFDSSTRRCLGHHPVLNDDPTRVTGNANAVGIVADIDAPTRALRLSPDGLTIARSPRREAKLRQASRVHALALEAADPLLEAVVLVLVESIQPGSDAENALPPNVKAILARLRGTLPALSVEVVSDLDEAVTAKEAQRALFDALPARGA